MFFNNVKLYTDGNGFFGFVYHPSNTKRGPNRYQKRVRKITDEDLEEGVVEEVAPKKQILVPVDEFVDEETGEIIECPFTDEELGIKKPILEEVDEFFDEETGELQVCPFPEEEWKFKEVIHNKKEEKTPAKKSEYTTLREEFDKAFDEAIKYKRRQRIPKITAYMSRYFDDKDSLLRFIDANVKRRYNAYKQRMVRFERKVYLNDFNYFCTFTYDNKKQSEESFKKRLLKTLQQLSTKRGWRYIAVWERGKETNRLHLHAMVYVPEGEMVGELKKEKKYDIRKHCMKTIFNNTYFLERFGRNDFESIDFMGDKHNTYYYIKKYMSKSNERAIYSRGLPDTFRADIDEDDVMGRFGPYGDKLLMFDDFHIYRDGKDLGEFEEFKQHYLYSEIKVPRLVG